jgi:formylglycine-generating enzyme required for sulfatase activity
MSRTYKKVGRDSQRARSRSSALAEPSVRRGLLLGLGAVALCVTAVVLVRRNLTPDNVDSDRTTAASALVDDAAPEAPAGSAAKAANKGTTASPFEPTRENVALPPGPAPDGMVWVPGGEFSMGSTDPRNCPCGGPDAMPDARPIHRVYVDGFWMDQTEVTNRQFAEFVQATGYVTVAERTPTLAEFPTAPPENLVAGSVVFAPTDSPIPLNDHYRWWTYIKGANWRQPLGPDSSIEQREDYPVVQVAYEDALAYCQWAGKRLPTEAEWEFAARGGRTGSLYPWGDDLNPNGQWMANIYQGRFPLAGGDTGEDGFVGIAPVGRFPANDYQLFDMSGNVWEWCSDWYRPDYFERLAEQGMAHNPTGPDVSWDPAEPLEMKRVHRGGSFLCTDQYCTRYMIGTRGKGEIRTGSNHLGFRCVKPAD